MQPIPQNMAQFFSENHVVSIATSSQQGLWSACCFDSSQLHGQTGLLGLKSVYQSQ